MTDVLVVGAGPTGLTLACLLRRHGIAVRVVDRLAEPANLAKAVFIWSRSLEILEGIGIASAAVTAGVGLERAHYHQGPRLLASVRMDRVPGTRWQPLGLPQAILERLLRERLQALGGDVCWGTEIKGVGVDGDGVSATAVKADGTTERFSAAYVVGCDGLRSVVRTAAGIGWQDRAPYEEIFQLGDVEADTCLDANTLYGFLGRNGASITIPMPGGLMRVAGYFAGEIPPDRAPDREALQRLLDEFGHEGTTITDVHWSGTYRVSRRLANDFRAGRLLLAGDAAHVHSPAGGQGLNAGIQDANNLAWKLALVARGVAEEKLLDSYTTERRSVAARILTITEMQDKWLFGAHSLLSRTVRNTAMRFADRTGMLQRKMLPDLAQVKIRYKDSPLSVNGGGGRRSPYVAGGQVPEVAFIAADGAPVALRAPEPDGAIALVAVPGLRRENGLTDIESLASEYPGTLRLRQASSPLPGENAGRAGLLLGVRPDGYIAYRGPCEVTPALRAWINTNVASPVAFSGRLEPRTSTTLDASSA